MSGTATVQQNLPPGIRVNLGAGCKVRDQAAWLSRRRRRSCRRGGVPVVCLVRPRGIERVEREVLVVSIDRLIPELRSGATGLGRSANELGMRGRIGQRRRLE